jgi:Zc3h12a-like Ribonuclease NYN domain/S1 RNA binding domain
MAPSYAVVDGSNIATEGRSVPSLAQLDEAVRQFQAEFPGIEVIVVVDATFGHRIDPSERGAFDEAVAHAELVSPPAGAVGRGDAFLLRVAERVGAEVLSNDSFQEFHAEHPWLFDEGRLIGGKPVPGVGWIFTPRSPVRGVRSRAALAEGSKKSAKAAKAAKTAKATKAAPTKSAKAARAEEDSALEAALSAAGADVVAAAQVPTRPAKKSKKAAGTDTAGKAPAAGKTQKAAKARKATEPKTAEPKKTDPSKKTTKSRVGAKDGAASAEGAVAQVDGPVPAPRSRRSRGRRATAPDVRAAIDVATVEAIAPHSDPETEARETSRRRRADAPPAVNDPLTFLTFVSDHPIGSTVEGTVSSFVSHGAMVDVGGMQCYVPLAGLAAPPPRRAREVVERSERREFVLVALDPARRGAELAVPEVAAPRLAR